jgi:heme/copper-type cytochrome/quinol oxidase subunit 4
MICIIEKLSLQNEIRVCSFVHRICTTEEMSFGVFIAVIVFIVVLWIMVQAHRASEPRGLEYEHVC